MASKTLRSSADAGSAEGLLADLSQVTTRADTATASLQPRLVDEHLKSDFVAAVNALVWADWRLQHAELIDSFVWLGWLRRDGSFTGLSDEGARVYVELLAGR